MNWCQPKAYYNTQAIKYQPNTKILGSLFKKPGMKAYPCVRQITKPNQSYLASITRNPYLIIYIQCAQYYHSSALLYLLVCKMPLMHPLTLSLSTIHEESTYTVKSSAICYILQNIPWSTTESHDAMCCSPYH